MRQGLTYHKMPVARVIILLVLTASAMLYINFSPNRPTGATPPELAAVLVSIFGLLLLISTAFHCVFILLQKRRIEFDECNMYIIRKKQESIIPLMNIQEIAMEGKALNGNRSWCTYRVTFVDNFGETVFISFWYKFSFRKDSMDVFQTNVINVNPTVKIKNSAFGWEGVLDLFKKRK